MHSLPAIVLSSPSNLPARTPTNGLRLEIGYQRRSFHAHSTDA
jgi:hypothetical protein